MKNPIPSHIFPLILCTMAFISSSCSRNGSEILLLYDNDRPQVQFAVDEIVLSLKAKDYTIKTGNLDEADESGSTDRIIIGTLADIRNELEAFEAMPSRDLSEEGFHIETRKEGPDKSLFVIGGDLAGAMYGGLELAEQLKIFGLDGVEETTRNPYMKMRGTKFNIPLDVRTPSYTDPCDAAQNNIIEMWNFDFWKDYLDNLARHRYNYVSLWSLHPFPSMVRVPEYPGVALDDVQRSTVKWKENYSLNGIGFDAPEIIDNVEVLKEITMDEKMAFWKKVMAYGKSRNIDFYVVTWNIFVNGTNGQYGITDRLDNEITRDYFRKSVRQMFLTYPDLAGIGLTTGENMHNRTQEEKEDWAFEAYALGLMDVAKEQPDRQFKFIHRQHQTGAKAIAARFSPLIEAENIDFLFSYKYAKAHVMSSTVQPFCEDFVRDIEGMKTIWTLRNDDNYYFRWGSPGFVREFIKNIPYEVSEGFYYGSDQWIWGREFLSLDPESPREIELSKHWYHWLIWGRLGYDPEIPDERFAAILAAHFPGVDAPILFTAWQEASMIYPVTTGFHWGSLDFQWYIEGCKSRPGPARTPTGFHDVERFISLPPHPGTNYQSIPDFAEMTAAGGSTNLVTPAEISDRLHGHSDKALNLLKQIEPVESKELQKTLNDITTIAYLGKYYAHKVAGALELELSRRIDTGKEEHRQNAVDELTKASEYWKLYIETAKKSYKNPLWTNRVGYVNWDQIYEWTLEDIAHAKR